LAYASSKAFPPVIPMTLCWYRTIDFARGFRGTRERQADPLPGRAKVFSGARKALLFSSERLLGRGTVERDLGIERAAVVRNSILDNGGSSMSPD
jgi:hypothetical protein